MDSLPPGLTCSSLTWKRGPMFSVSKWPQGRWFRRCCSCSLRPLLRRRSTILETSCARCAVGHQQRVGRVDDDEIAHADGRHQRLLAVDVAVVRVLEHGGAAGEVAVPRRAAPAPTATTRSRRRSSRRRSAAPPPCRCAPSRHSRWRCRARAAKALASRRRKPRSSLAPSSAALAASRMAGCRRPSSSRNACAPSTKMPLFQA